MWFPFKEAAAGIQFGLGWQHRLTYSPVLKSVDVQPSPMGCGTMSCHCKWLCNATHSAPQVGNSDPPPPQCGVTSEKCQHGYQTRCWHRLARCGLLGWATVQIRGRAGDGDWPIAWMLAANVYAKKDPQFFSCVILTCITNHSKKDSGVAWRCGMWSGGRTVALTDWE